MHRPAWQGADALGADDWGACMDRQAALRELRRALSVAGWVARRLLSATARPDTG